MTYDIYELKNVLKNQCQCVKCKLNNVLCKINTQHLTRSEICFSICRLAIEQNNFGKRGFMQFVQTESHEGITFKEFCSFWFI